MKRVNLKLKKNVKTKFIVLALSLICFLSFGILASASKETKFVIETTPETTKESYQRGDEVAFVVKLDTEEEYHTVNFMIDYDHDALELISDFDTAADSSGWTLVMCNATVTDAISCGFTKLVTPMVGNKNLATFRFRVKDEALGETSITFSEDTDTAVTVYRMEPEEQKITTSQENKTIYVDVPVTNVTLATENIEIDLGSDNKTAQIQLDVTPKVNNDKRVVTYTPVNGDILDVSESGLITAKKVGDTDIKVEAYGQSFLVHVSIKAHIQGVTLNASEKTLNLNNKESFQFIATINPADVSDSKAITWTSTKSDVADVVGGLVTAKSIGTTTITATTSNGKTDSAIVTVIAPAKSIKINEADFTLTKNNTNNKKQLSVTIDPNPTTDSITWEVDDGTVVSVSQEGLVTALSGGHATITVKAGSQSDTVNVTVDVAVEDIILDVQADETITLYPTQKRTVTGSVLPADATEKKITWSIAESNIAEVNENGVITAKAPGNAVLTASAGGKSVTRNIKVLTPVSSFVVDTPNITLNANTKESAKVKTTILPDNTDVNKEIAWKSENTSVATVIGGANGEATITAVALGHTQVTGTLEDGSVVTVEVNVIAPITGVTLNKSNVKLIGVGSRETLQATITPDPTSDAKTLTWTSSSDDIARVEDGVIIAVSKGHAVITVETVNGKKATCEVDVLVPATSVKIDQGEHLILDRGHSSTLTATINPTGTSDTLSWSSSDSNIVSVSQDGTILAKAIGTATITAQAGNVKDTIEVEVIVKIDEFSLVSASSVDVLRGSTSTIVTKINPTDTTEDKTITWTSDAEEIATVSKDGVITGVSEGTATITGKLKNGLTVEVEVTVNIIDITDMSAKTDELDLLKGQRGQLELVIEPSETTQKDLIKWTSDDDDIVSVDENGVVTAHKEGTATVTATYKDLEVTFEVNVTEVHLESIEVTNSKSTLNVGDELQLQVATNPTNTTDDLTFTYKTSDASIATVSDDGLVKAVGAGKVTITVTASNGVETTFVLTINNISVPATGDNIITYIIALLASTIGIVVVALVVFRNKKSN